MSWFQLQHRQFEFFNLPFAFDARAGIEKSDEGAWISVPSTLANWVPSDLVDMQSLSQKNAVRRNQNDHAAAWGI